MARKARGKAAPPAGGRRVKCRELSDFERVLHEVLVDDEFASLLKESPEKALGRLRIKVTPEKLLALKFCRPPLRECAELFGGQIDPRFT